MAMPFLRPLRRFISCCLLLLPLLASAQQKKEEAWSLYLIGDAGERGEEHSGAVLKLLNEVVGADSTQERVLVFLGDNIYERGLHKKNDKDRAQDEANINAQIDAARSFPGKSYFVPGNHDWDKGGKRGWKAVQRQEKYIEDTLGRNAFRPDHGCPGPEVVELGDHAVLVMFDSQWWLQQYRRPEGERDGCTVTDEEDLLRELSEVLKDHRGKHIILAAHHPLRTYGAHGGHFPLRDHVFPLTRMVKWLWVPLPGAGSLYPMYRGLIGDVQDVAHEHYNDLRVGIEGVLKSYPGSVYAAGHEHTLQYHEVENTHHVVSGSGAKTTWMPKRAPLAYGASERGFARIIIASDGAMRLDFFTVAHGARPDWSQRIEGPPADALLSLSDRPKPELPGSTTVVPNADLQASGLHRLFFGDLYRDVWTAPITVPVIDLDTAFGGMRAKGIGGGLQTRSLRLKAKNGHEYVMRTIKKYPGLALSPELRGTVVEDLVSDGIAGSHPYAALVVSPLADAAGVYHTHGELVFLPDHPALGLYRDAFANSLCLLEERTDGDWSDEPSLGRSKALVSSGELIAALRTTHKAVLDDRAVLRARLFDMLIGDWDRHDDQWRWATFHKGDSTIYRPVPRDRDQAFFKQDGIFPSLVNRRWAISKFQSFGPKVRDIDGQNFNARYFDRAYLTGLDWNTWRSAADSLRAALPDAVIEDAVHHFPDTTFTLIGPRIINGLKGRRDGLESIARRQYLSLAKYVNVVGTDGDEFFDVERLPDGRTEVGVYDRKHGKKVAKKRYFHRVFEPNETREIRIYGLEGNDEYRVSGNVDRAILLRIIGGTEKDKIQDSSHVSGWGRRTIVYESGGSKKGNKLQLGPEAKLKRSERSDALDHDRAEYVPDVLMPLLALGANKDDGLFLGGGFRYTRQGFKVEPFKWRHQFTGSYAAYSGAYRLAYKGRVNQAIGKYDLGLKAGALAPDFNFNFFGYGNRTERPKDNELFEYRLDLIDIEPSISRVFSDIHEVTLSARSISVSQGKLSRQLEGTYALDEQGDADYAGAMFNYTLTNVDRPNDPTRGIRFSVEADALREVHDERDVFGFGGDLRLYFPVRFLPGRTVWALRMAAYRRAGEIDPLLARSVGSAEMRGLRRGRFSGNSSAYANVELRKDLFTSRNRIVPFRMGLIALADAGRVWVDGRNEHFWHTAGGGGLYISPLEMLVLQATYAVSDDDAIFDMRLGFFF